MQCLRSEGRFLSESDVANVVTDEEVRTDKEPLENDEKGTSSKAVDQSDCKGFQSECGGNENQRDI